MDFDQVELLRSRVVAVGSGNGGVGKSTTAVNLAIVAAKQKKRVALVDLDPLSNMATILDVRADRVERVAERVARGDGRLSAWTVPLFPRIDLLFPRPKLEAGESARLRSALFRRSAAELIDKYDLIVCDMPAGIGHEENLAFLPYVGLLLVVTNPEPTSHVSAGGYVRVALEIQDDLRILFWHNRFKQVLPGGFGPTAVVDNYNRYVDDDLRIPEEAKARIGTVARVPEDPSLDLLRQSLSSEVQVLGKLLDTTNMLHRVIIAALDFSAAIDRRLREELRYFLSSCRLDRVSGLDDEAVVERLLADAGDYLTVETDTPEIRKTFRGYVEHPLVPPIHAAVEALAEAIEAMTSRDRMFAHSGEEAGKLRRARRDLTALIDSVNADGRGAFARNLGGMLICYLSLLMIMESRRVRTLLADLVPIRAREKGRPVKDRRMLIRNLVVRNAEYHKRYFELVKTLFPVVLKQVNRLVDRGGWSRLLLRSSDGAVNRNAYLKILTQTLHDVLHAGLGVYVGFRYNTAGRAIEEGAKRLIGIVESISPPTAAPRHDSESTDA